MVGLPLVPGFRPVLSLCRDVGWWIGVSSWVLKLTRLIANTRMKLANPVGSRVFQPSSVLLSPFPKGDGACLSNIYFPFPEP